jgi:hypothetical protein
MVGETLYACLDSVVNASLMPVRFTHRVTKHVYQVEGVEYSLRHPNELLFRAFDINERKYVYFNASHLRLLERIWAE